MSGSTQAPCLFGLLPLRTGCRLMAVSLLVLSAFQLLLVLWLLAAADVPVERWIQHPAVYATIANLVMQVILHLKFTN